MKLLGITGGIGMGKSTAAKMLEELGAAIADTDLIAREIVQPGQPALEEIRARFGAEIVDSTGWLRREELARRVFSDEAARRDLEAILHLRIRAEWLARSAAWRREGRRWGAVVIPLLFETQAESEFDAVVCVACTPETQQERLAQRGWTSEQARQRIRAQLPVEKKMLLADFVLWSEGELEVLGAQWPRVLAKL